MTLIYRFLIHARLCNPIFQHPNQILHIAFQATSQLHMTMQQILCHPWLYVVHCRIATNVEDFQRYLNDKGYIALDSNGGSERQISSNFKCLLKHEQHAHIPLKWISSVARLGNTCANKSLRTSFATYKHIMNSTLEITYYDQGSCDSKIKYLEQSAKYKNLLVV